MKIEDVIEALFVPLEQDVEVTEPYPAKLRRAYTLLPRVASAIELPCTMHQYRLDRGPNLPNQQRRLYYIVRTSLLVARATDAPEESGLIGAAFDYELQKAYVADIAHGSAGAGDGFAHRRLRDGSTATAFYPDIIPWNDVGYVGFQYEFEVQILDSVPIGV